MSGVFHSYLLFSFLLSTSFFGDLEGVFISYGSHFPHYHSSKDNESPSENSKPLAPEPESIKEQPGPGWVKVFQAETRRSQPPL